MSEATEVQYSRDGETVVRVSDPVLAHEIATLIAVERERGDYFHEQCKQARGKASKLAESLELVAIGKVASKELAHSLALEINVWRDKVAAAERFALSTRTQGEDFASRARKAVRDLEDFKAQVRDAAITVREENDWCLDGLNDVLEQLGLPKYSPKKYVEFKVRVLVEGQDDEDDATSAAQSFLEGVYGDDDCSIEEVDHRRTWDADEN